MKRLSLLFLISGLLAFIYGGIQFIQAKKEQQESLQEAKRMLDITPKPDTAPTMLYNTKDEFQPEAGETIGLLSIEKIDAELAIVEGTSEEELEKGVGHYTGSALPQQGQQIVLSGHRDTVFRRMGEIEKGDHVVVKLPYGNFPYRVISTKVVSADDRTVIQPNVGREELVISTCYPFTYVGNAPDRYIITALPVQ